MDGHHLATALTALVLTVAAPVSCAWGSGGDGSSERALCLELTHFAVGANAKAGRWLDRVTRHDGVVVACADKRVEFKRFTTIDRARDGWEEQKELELKRASCTNGIARRAMDGGWTILATYTLATGDDISVSADCD
jgi:hypothetical protein